MRRMMQLTMTTMMVAGALFVTGRGAAADEIDTYRDAMRGFAPVIGDWLDEVETLAEAARLKPEIVTGPALADLALRGRTMHDDLSGTTAPGTYAEAHAALTDALAALAAAAEAAPARDGRSFADAVGADLANARQSLRDIRSYAVRGGKGRIAIPVPPVTGN